MARLGIVLEFFWSQNSELTTIVADVSIEFTVSNARRLRTFVTCQHIYIISTKNVKQQSEISTQIPTTYFTTDITRFVQNRYFYTRESLHTHLTSIVFKKKPSHTCKNANKLSLANYWIFSRIRKNARRLHTVHRVRVRRRR
jgi:hypothetical protein